MLTGFVFIMSLIGLISVIYKVVQRCKAKQKISIELATIGLFFVVFMFFLGHIHSKNVATENNLEAVYNYFEPSKVTSVSATTEGELYQAHVENTTYDISVKNGQVISATAIQNP